MPADFTSLFTAHLKVLREAAKVAGVDLDANTVWTKNIATIRSGVVVPTCDINTEATLYIIANG
jgi:hypothetical protein